MNLNDFYFTGTVASTPETKAFQSNSKTEFRVEQTTTYREKDRITVVTVQNWHKGESHTQHLKPGDVVMVKGRFSSSPYKDRHILNLDATVVVPLSGFSAAPALKPVDDNIPF